MDKQRNAGQIRYIRPKRAEKKFKLAQELRQGIYLYGMTGCGKTAFVKDMLGAKSYHYFSAAQTEAGDMSAFQDGRRHTVVIDDLQEVADSQHREEYTSQIRLWMDSKNVWLILISRCVAPRWFVQLYVEYTFLSIKEEDLLLDRQEQDEFFEKCKVALPPDQADLVWKKANGHPLFLRFAAMAGGDWGHAADDMWKYLVFIYEQWDTQIQEFVAEVSVLDRFDNRMAQIVTGRSNVRHLMRQILEMGNFFQEKDGMYEYTFFLKDSFREFLNKRLERDRLVRIYYNAGHMYELYGDIPNALKMYEAAGDTDSILRMLVANARQNPANGHYFELRRYYLMLSEEAICSNPVLIAGMSMLQSMLMNGEESERWYRLLEKFAAEHSGSAKREAKNRLLYLDIALPHRGTVQMVSLLKHAGSLLKSGKALLPEFSVTSNLPSMMNGGKDFCEWSKRDLELASGIGKIVEFVLGKFGKGLVSIALAESFLEKGMDNYEIVSLAEKGRLQAEAGGKTELVFVAVGILVWLSVLNGHADDAQDMLDSFLYCAKKTARKLIPNLEAFRCRLALYQGKTPKILEWMEQAPDENTDFCSLERFRYLTKIRVYIQYGRYDKAYALLRKMQYYAQKQKRDYIANESMILLAIVKYHQKEAGWEALLQKSIDWAQDYHFVRIFSREGAAVLKPLKEGGFLWQDQAYRKQVMKECTKMSQYYPAYLKEKSGEDVVLSENALNILRLQAEGYSTSQIAKHLGITQNTVKYHSKETYRKFHVSSKTAAVNEAKNRGLL